MRRLAWGLVLACAACGSSFDNSTPERACDSLLTLAAAQLDRCVGLPTDEGLVFTILGTAVVVPPESFDTVCVAYARSVANGRAQFDAGRFAACESTLQAQGCGAVMATSNPCDGVFGGTVPAGGACFLNFDCASNTCFSDSATCPGTCAGIAGQGEPCGANVCANGLACVGTGTGGTTVCEPLVGVGQSCAHAACDAMSFCDFNSQLCAPPIADGLSCHGGACAVGRQCIGPVTGGVCGVPSKLGEHCTAGMNQCLIGLYCNNGLCTELPRVGQSCGTFGLETPVRCITGFCSNGVCLPPLPLGSTCDGADERCVDGSFCLIGPGAPGVCTASACLGGL